MQEKYKNYLKKFGIAGFLFFLIKGILWLIFGTALYKWFKGLIIASMFCSLPLCVYCQIPQQENLNKQLLLLHQLEFSNDINKNIVKINRSFFCKIEDRYLQKNKMAFSFRLGSKAYTNTLEYPFLSYVSRQNYTLK